MQFIPRSVTMIRLLKTLYSNKTILHTMYTNLNMPYSNSFVSPNPWQPNVGILNPPTHTKWKYLYKHNIIIIIYVHIIHYLLQDVHNCVYV